MQRFVTSFAGDSKKYVIFEILLLIVCTNKTSFTETKITKLNPITIKKFCSRDTKPIKLVNLLEKLTCTKSQFKYS